MKTVLAIFVLATANFSFASTNGLSCSVTGANLLNSSEITDRYVGASSPSTLTAILKEDEGSGTYMTYVKLNITYRTDSRSPVEITTTTSFSDVLAIEFHGPYIAELFINSRVDRPPMSLKVECAPVSLAYLLIPRFDQLQDPLDAVQNAAFTLPKYLKDLADGIYFHPSAESESEFLAEHFCVEGDSQAAFIDLKDNRSYATMWRTSALGDHVLNPQNLRLEKNTVRWEQPRDSAVCIRSHIEDVVDDDGIPYQIEVCDEYRLDQLPPLALEIGICK